MSDAPDTSTPVVLEVVAGPLDGLRFEGKRARVRIGRSDGAAPDKTCNDLVLQRDSYASSFHADVYLENGRWWLVDKGSTNGTWLGRRKLEHRQPVELHENELFVVGNSVIRFSTQPTGLPPIDPAAATRLSPASQTVLNRARNAAKARDLPWIGASSLLRALAETEAEPIPSFFAQAGLSPDEMCERSAQWNRWEGELAWIERDVLRGKKFADRGGKSVLPTPRLQLIMTLAARAADQCGAPQIEPIHLLQGLFQEPGNRVVLALEAAGHPRQTLAALADRIAREHYRPITPPPAESTVSLAPRLAMPAPAAPPRRPVDPETWLLARSLMDRLQALQTEFHLAEPAVRLEALCAALRDGLQQAPPAKRELVIEVLAELFPVLTDALLPAPIARPSEATPPSIPTEPPHQTIDESAMAPARPRREARPAAAPASSEALLDTAKLLELVFGSEPGSRTMGGDNGSNPFVELTHELYRFALDMEQLAKSLVQTLHGGGGGESRYFLPFTVQDLRMMIQKLLRGRHEEAVMEIRDYLYDLGHWIVALIAAHQKATSQWNRDLWERISPQAIRNEAKGGALNKMLGVSKADLWQTYERIARDLKPEVTEDQLNEKIGKIATEEFHRLSARR